MGPFEQAALAFATPAASPTTPAPASPVQGADPFAVAAQQWQTATAAPQPSFGEQAFQKAEDVSGEFVGNVFKSSAGLLANSGAFASGLFERVNRTIGNDEGADYWRQQLPKYGEFQGKVEEAYPTTAAAKANPVSPEAIAGIVGHMAPDIVAAVLTQGASLPVTTGANSAGSAYQNFYKAAKDKGLSDDDANRLALVGGSGSGVVNALIARVNPLAKAGGFQGSIPAKIIGGIGVNQAIGVATSQVDPLIGAGLGLNTATPDQLTKAAAQSILPSTIAGIAGGGVDAFVHTAPAKGEPQPRVAQTDIPVPSAETLASLTTGPSSLLEAHSPKVRLTDGGVSRGVDVEFSNPQDKALFAAGYPRRGKISAEAEAYLQASGMTPEDIASQSARIRADVEKAAQAHAGDGPLVYPPEANSAGVVERPSDVVAPVEAGLEVLPQQAADARPESVGGKADVQGTEHPADADAARQQFEEEHVQHIDWLKALQDQPRNSPERKSKLQQQIDSANAKFEAEYESRFGPPDYTPEAESPTPEAYLTSRESLRRGPADEHLEGVMPGATRIAQGLENHQEYLDIHKELTGKDAIPYIGGRGRGFRSKGETFYSVERNRTPQQKREAIAHEATHALQDARPDLIAEIDAAIPQKTREALAREYAESYKAQEGKALDPSMEAKEVQAMAVGRAFSRSSVAREVMQKNPSALIRAVDAVTRTLRSLTSGGRLTNQIIATLKRVRAEAKAAGGVDNSQGRLREADPAKSFLPESEPRIRDEAEDYARQAGVPYRPSSEYVTVNEPRAKRIAAAYESLKHTPNDPAVKASYDALKKETLAQWNYLKDQGVKFEKWTKEGQPYASSAEMMTDARQNKHLYYFPGGDMPANHPLAEKAPDTAATYNDVFRAVHDYFGHAKEGVGFGPRGEENAWRQHSAMYSDAARPAMTTETRGQNSWVNYGPKGEANRAKPTETQYAEQKAGLLPPEFNRVEPQSDVAALNQRLDDFLNRKQEVDSPEKVAAEKAKAVKEAAVDKTLVEQGKFETPEEVPQTEADKAEGQGFEDRVNAADLTDRRVEKKPIDPASERRFEELSKRATFEPPNETIDAFLPGTDAAKKFYQEELEPAVSGLGKAWAGFKNLIGAQTGKQANTTRGILRERGAELAQRQDRLNHAFELTRKAMGKLPQAATRDFIDKMEKGLPQADPKLQPAADALRGILDDRLAQVQKLGKLKEFVKDYFPHLWKDPTKAASVVAEGLSKRPLEGGKKFLKRRSLPLFSDGIAKGLEPVTENPVEAAMMRVREMDKFITAQQAFREMQSKGLLLTINAREKVPAGFAKIEDNIATTFAAPTRKGALQIHKYAVAPEPVASIINNFLSPGIRGNKAFGPAFRAYLAVGNVMNQAQLGLSGFHLTFTMFDAAVSKAALALKQTASGDYTNAAKSAVLASSIVGPGIENFRRGNLVMKEWLTPGSTTPEIAQIVDTAKAAGARIGMDDFYKSGMTNKMLDAFKKGNIIGGAMRSPFAAVEQASRPILEKLVPRMKLGAFMDLARYEIAKLPPGADREQVRAAMGKAWDSVDNRLGEMVYDNIFWNKAVKDLGMASVRAVGWNLGTFRELGGGLADYIKAGKNIATGNKAEFTHRMAYTTALPVLTGILGGITHYLLTGKHPEEMKDWFFPQTGEKDKDGHAVRLAMPGYMGDVFKYGADVKKAAVEGKPGAAFTTLKHKSHPLLNTIMEMLSNEDYYGTKIRNEDDPFVKQLLGLAEHAGKSFLPFGARDVKKLYDQGQGAKSLLPLVGIVQARKDITNTAAELKAAELLRERMPQGSRTREEADRAETTRNLADELRKKNPDAREHIRTAFETGKISESDVESIKDRQTNLSLLERSVKRLDIKDGMRVWDSADDDEKRRIGKFLFSKVRGSTTLTREERVAIIKRLQDDWKRLKAGAIPEDAQ